MAPPDATRPTIEDNLHLGCQWRVPSSSLKLDIFNAVGRHAMGVAGMHLVNHIRGQHAVQGIRAVGKAKKLTIREDAKKKQKGQHCTLVCKAKALLALSDMLLTFLVPEHNYHKTDAVHNAQRSASTNIKTAGSAAVWDRSSSSAPTKAVYEVRRMHIHL